MADEANIQKLPMGNETPLKGSSLGIKQKVSLQNSVPCEIWTGLEVKLTAEH